MNIETIAASVNRQDIPERDYLYMYETEIYISKFWTTAI